MKVRLQPENLNLKRAYEKPAAGDGVRILVDRLWPRGVSRSGAAIDMWMKEIAPSSSLRKWFNHDPARWDEFRAQYKMELCQKSELVNQLRDLIAKGQVSLIYSARDQAHNDAVVLQEVLLDK
ncbi:uncharacterized protein YeaO (DUF488 family) [Methylobacterium sp. OAE515]|uniref:DUF488 domain-containing protein n=1 Tax=Methylobacterium sp. OAE515 TaxID=2817895 RepID=UPI0017895399